MFFGILLVCQMESPMNCQFLNSRSVFPTIEDCANSAITAVSPPGTYIAGRTCLRAEFLDPDA